MTDQINVSITIPANILYKCIELILPTYVGNKVINNNEEDDSDVDDIIETYKRETSSPLLPSLSSWRKAKKTAAVILHSFLYFLIYNNRTEIVL